MIYAYIQPSAHELILEYQHRAQLYEQARTHAQNTRMHSEYQRKTHLHQQFSQHVLAGLNTLKSELANHG
ncbi:hypothetical protein CWB96_21380 [Pseudoalteromonas citrea]|uniref:Uncharacterized protein n=1 Tax=Pseudoalteromonas citrea TaxID=43655 RepID=A0A5S3XK12_9GAMM|nr:hypothetical protein CWB97_13465 [Pseudoalteromonas citrea]TMP53287.1 hypothetical protein CWB96_21380 [Pseudoalteromonas citrea]